MVKYILNGWSWGMPRPKSGVLVYHEISEKEFKLQSHDAISLVSHPAMANLLGIECNNEYIKLNKGDTVFVVSTDGGKLSHEARSLPKGITFRYTCVKILEEI